LKLNNEVYFKNHLIEGEKFSINCTRNHFENIYISYFSKTFPHPYPPFSIINPKSFSFVADSVWTIPNQDYFSFELKYNGMYHFRIDSTKKDGITLFNYDEYFPEFKTANKMIDPLIFITSKKEMKQLLEFGNPKLAIDSFWLKKSGNINRAKQLISVYYSRAKYSNIYFSSYQEGWKTDRGMIYSIFGEPSTIYKSNKNERWIYGNSNSDYSLDFTFNKVQNTFSENDYVLIRNDIYKNSWYKAIETWRDGRIYSIGK
jgi:GWxTD domain-containing protein